MELKIVFGLAAVACELVSALVYWRGILRGETKPHLYTHLIFSIVLAIGFFGILAGGGEAGAWALVVALVLSVSVFFASLKWGTTDITWSDKVFLAFALAAILPWVVTKDPLWSIVMIAIIDVFAMAPTLRKTYRDPTSEPLSAWILAMARGVLQLLAMGTYSLTTVLYPLEILLVEATLVYIIVTRAHNR